MAEKIFGVPVRKARSNDPKPVADRLSWMRGIGKTAELGCGYGMGAAKFEATYKVDAHLAQKAVTEWRKANQPIVKMWYEYENAFKAVCNGRVARMAVGRIQFHHEPSVADCVVRLPSGRCLFYHSVRTDDGRLAVFQPREKQWAPTWGGALVENVVQATARDLLAEAIKRFEDVGYHVSLTIHDSVYVVTAPDPDKVLLMDIFTAPPTWADGCPIAAEVKIGVHI